MSRNSQSGRDAIRPETTGATICRTERAKAARDSPAAKSATPPNGPFTKTAKAAQSVASTQERRGTSESSSSAADAMEKKSSGGSKSGNAPKRKKLSVVPNTNTATGAAQPPNNRRASSAATPIAPKVNAPATNGSAPSPKSRTAAA
ncbi:MAG: hypothetical protein HYZ28_15585 [Myxococcales bacterium]|nr:hypothetical protein [Myxococcales bacterium]